MALTLQGTGEVLLDGTEFLGSFYVDRTGGIGLESEVIRKCIERLVRALNIEHDQVVRLQTEMDEMHGVVHSLKELTSDHSKLFAQAQDGVMDIRIEMGKLAARLDMMDRRALNDRGNSGVEGDFQQNKILEELRELKDASKDLGLRTEAAMKAQREDGKKFASQLEECEEKLARHAVLIEEELDQRLRDADEAVLSLKLDLEAAQVSLTESNKVKATRAELADMQRTLKAMQQDVQADHATLEEAATNLGKLHECVSMAKENKARSEDIWRVYREESQELREWAARALAELREGLREKMDRSAAMHKLQELEANARGTTAHLAEAAARAEAGIQRKADAGELAKVMHSMREIQTQGDRRTRQLLVGTKCLACDRDINLHEVTEAGALDAAREKQQQDLYREVQRVLSVAPTPGLGQDVVKLVAVHVGSARRLHGNGVSYETRDIRDTSPGSHRLIMSRPSSARGSTPRGPGLGAARMLADAGDLPARSPAREVPPLLRASPRPVGEEALRPRGGAPAPGRSLARTPADPAPVHGSIRSALGLGMRQHPSASIR